MKKTDNITMNPCGVDTSCVLEALRGLTAAERRELLRILTEKHGVSVLRKMAI